MKGMARRLLWAVALVALLGLVGVAVVARAEELPAKLSGLTAEQESAIKDKSETFGFQAEVSRLMKLIVNSLYKNKEIFLRELISNASDALDKIRFLSLTNKDALNSQPELRIDVRADSNAKTVTITDTGIGMTKNDLVVNLGTVAKSGTADFMERAENSGDLGLIGQFGVGFYSAFLVADRVTVISKHNDDDQYIWESDADGQFTVAKDPRGNTLGRGTQIILHLKDEASSFSDQYQVKELIKKYSEFINFPIYLWMTKKEKVEVPADSSDHSDDDSDVADVTDDDSEGEGEDTVTVEQEVTNAERLNENKPIWTRSPDDLTEQDYIDFYKMFSKDELDPIGYTHFKAEGELDFKSILYIPGKPPSNLWVGGQEGLSYVKLFVKRVFITDDMPDLLPRYLKFIKGVVDSDDLPLNVSRETLQQHKLMRVMRKKITRKILDMLKKMATDEPERYLKFYKEYSNAIKFGIMEDMSNRERLAELLRFPSSTSGGAMVSLEEYANRMKKGQDNIYIIAGTSLLEIDTSPLLERLKARGYEVLYLRDPVDEWTFQSLADYRSIRFQDVAKEGLKFADEDNEELEVKFAPLMEWLKETLSRFVDKVLLSSHLTRSPCTLLASQYGATGNMERIMRAQAYQQGLDTQVQAWETMRKKLEINAKHPIIQELLERVIAGKTGPDTVELAHVLYDTAALRAGYSLRDQELISFADRIDRIVRENLGVDLYAEAVVDEPLAEDKDPEPVDDYSSGHDHDEL